jgi:hypothetical protein
MENSLPLSRPQMLWRNGKIGSRRVKNAQKG